ncbi:MAG TPA: terminase family protein [Rhizomicrobium sp.]|nr:terminase family protein [Rhizomicrobium sp.]
MKPSRAKLLSCDSAATKRFLDSLSNEEALLALSAWDLWARPEQLAPKGDWTIWLYLGGRGAGKTRAGAEWVRARVNAGGAKRIALVSATLSEARDVMIEGESGLLAISSPLDRPRYEKSNRRVLWPNGAVAHLFSDDEPDMLRGTQNDTAWCDELAKWKHLDATFDNLMLGLRLGTRPQVAVTTTPRTKRGLRAIMTRGDTVLTRGSTHDNRDNLAPAFFRDVIRRYEGTRFGRQEIHAELLDDVPGGLWTRAMIDAALLAKDSKLPEMVRVVVAVDPSGARGGDGLDKMDGRSSIGIIAAGRGIDGLGYILGDYTCALSPAGWGRRVAEAAAEFGASRIIAEENFGGAMVESVICAAGTRVPVKLVRASQRKVVRAEPVAALYEQKRIRHWGGFPALEDQLIGFTTTGYVGEASPDRADAAIWALIELMLSPMDAAGWLDYARQRMKGR